MDTFLSVVFWNAVGATLLALAAAALGLLCRRPALVHSLWLLVLLKLITPPLFVLPLAFPSAEVVVHDSGVSAVVRMESDPDAVAISLPVGPLPEAPREDDPSPRVSLGIPRSTAAEPPVIAHDDSPPEPSGPEYPWKSVGVTLWATGSLLWWLVLAVRIRQFRMTLSLVKPAPAALQERTRLLAQKLRLTRPPEIGFVAAPISPLVWGLSFRPRLLLPAALWERLGEDQRETLLLHELAHLRRRDHWVRVVELVVLSLYWWHPVAWWARSRLQQAEEQCCDAWVVWALPDKAEAYAAALLETVTFLSQAHAPLPVGASGIGKVRFLKRRLTMILRDRAPRGLTWGGLIAVLFLAACLLPLAAVPAEPPQEEGKQPPAGAETQAAPTRSTTLSAPTMAGPTPTGTGATTAARPVAQEASQAPRQASGTEGPSPNPQTTTQSPAQQTQFLGPDHPKAGPEIRKLRDQIEVMQAQLQVKAIQVEAARKKLEHAKQDLNRVKSLEARRVISVEDADKARQRVDELEYELKLKEAELLEPGVLLQQARRRLVALTGQPGSLPETPEARASWGPHLFKEREHDFGSVSRGTRLSHKFFMNNFGKNPIVITGVRTSASFVTAVAKTQSLVSGPNDHILVEVDTSRFTGPKLFKVFVQFEPPGKAKFEHLTTLTLKADSREGGETGTSAREQSDKGDRVRDLEQKIDRLLREMDDLRRELKSRQPERKQSLSPSAPSPGTLTAMLLHDQRAFNIPFNVDESKGKIDKVRLFASRDEGHTWQLVAEARPTEQQFRFHAPADGTYWFDVRTIDEQGNQSPAGQQFRPTLKINVQTQKQ